MGFLEYIVESFLALNWLGYVYLSLVVIFILGRIRVTLQGSSPAKWQHALEGFNYSSKEFYDELKSKLEEKNLPELKRMKLVLKTEGGFFSKRRYYLRIGRYSHYIYVCAAPFGTAYFFSSWILLRISLLRAIVYRIPYLGQGLHHAFWRETFYKQDTEFVFHSVVHSTVLELVESITKSAGVKPLTEEEKKPVMTEIFKR